MPYEIHPDDESPEARLCRVVNVMEALPPPYNSNVTDETALRDVLPGAWPTFGDLRALAAKHFKKAE